MRGLEFEKKSGGAAIFLALLGLVTIMIALFFLYLNNQFSAFGFVEATGGEVLSVKNNIWTIGVDVKSGGSFGMLAGWAGSILVTVIQLIFWVHDPNVIFRTTDKLFRQLMYLLIVYDFLSTVYYLTSLGIETFPLELPFAMATWHVFTLNGLIQFGLILFISFAFLSVGSEFWLALGWTLFSLHIVEAISVVQNWLDNAQESFERSRLNKVDRRIDQMKQQSQTNQARPAQNFNRPNQPQRTYQPQSQT